MDVNPDTTSWKPGYDLPMINAKHYMKPNVFIEESNVEWEVIDDKVKRKVMAYDKNLMVVKVAFEEGGVGTLHQHYHSQVTHIESGVFEVQINEEKKVLREGDAFYIPPNVMHGVICLEKGVLIDAFSPMREDFMKRPE